MHTTLSLALLLLLALAGNSETATTDAPIRADVRNGALAETIHSDLAALVPAGFNGAIIVEHDGGLVLDAGYGWANRERAIPFTTSTIAQIGSLTKQFTAAAVVDLSRRQKLRIDDALSDHLQNVPARARSITLHQLLTHTAGFTEDCGGDFERVTREELVSRCLAAFNPAAHRPFTYSNLGYSLLGSVVETVSGTTLEGYLRERFFEPLGMNDTGYFFEERDRRRLAFGYAGGQAVPPISERLQAMNGAFWNLKGNGGMQASAKDMHRWYRALSEGDGITPAMRKALTSPQTWRDKQVAYGYGWFVRTGESGEVEQVSHTGSDGVFFSAFVWRPRERFFYYLVTNAGEKIGAETASLVLKRFRESMSAPTPG
jgi:CubicO group peptidase (beta-lactamase class C family)